MSEYKDTKAPVTTLTINRDEVIKPTGNIYMAIVIIAKRAEQIQQEMKEEFNKKISEFSDEDKEHILKEVYEKSELIDISKYYERLPKPWAMALQEWLEGKIQWRFADEESDENREIF